MTKHIVYSEDGTTIIKEVDIEKGVTLAEMRDTHGLMGGTNYRLRATSALSPAFTVPVAAVAPTAAGGIADQSWVKDIPISALDVSADFTGTAPITYALAPSSAPLPAGLSLSSSGSITGTPTSPAASASIIVRGTNAHGSDDSAFGVTVTSANDTTAPAIENFSYDNSTGEVTLDITEASGSATVVWATSATGDIPTYSIGSGWSGAIYETGNFGVVSGANTGTLTTTAATPDGTSRLTIYVYDADDNLSQPGSTSIVTGAGSGDAGIELFVDPFMTDRSDFSPVGVTFEDPGFSTQPDGGIIRVDSKSQVNGGVPHVFQVTLESVTEDTTMRWDAKFIDTQDSSLGSKRLGGSTNTYTAPGVYDITFTPPSGTVRISFTMSKLWGGYLKISKISLKEIT